MKHYLKSKMYQKTSLKIKTDCRQIYIKMEVSSGHHKMAKIKIKPFPNKDHTIKNNSTRFINSSRPFQEWHQQKRPIKYLSRIPINCNVSI